MKHFFYILCLFFAFGNSKITAQNSYYFQGDLWAIDAYIGVEMGSDPVRFIFDIKDTSRLIIVSDSIKFSSLNQYFVDRPSIKYVMDIDSLGNVGYRKINELPITYQQIIDSLGFVPSDFSGSYIDLTNKPTIPTNTNQLTNGAGFLVSSDILGKLNISDTSSMLSPYLRVSQAASTYSTLGHAHTFASLTSKPTTLSGYGITDAYPLIGNPSGYLTSEVDGSTSNEIELPTQTGNGGRTLVTNGSTVSWGKRQETYSGSTNSSGEYTVTFGTSYSTAPNIQANIIGGNANQVLTITSISTTGFTVKVVERQTDTILGIVVLRNSTTNVNGASIHVLITEQ